MSTRSFSKSISLDEERLDRLENAADEQNTSESEIVRRALDEFLEGNDDD